MQDQKSLPQWLQFYTAKVNIETDTQTGSIWPAYMNSLASW